MDWTSILEFFVIGLNAFSLVSNIYLTNKTRNNYQELSEKLAESYREQQNDFQFHVRRLVEEINLLKTHEGLYDVRNDEKKYQLYLSLLRKE